MVAVVCAGVFACCLGVLLATSGGHRRKVALLLVLQTLSMCGLWGMISMVVENGLVFIAVELVCCTCIVYSGMTGAYLYPWAVLGAFTTVVYTLCDCHVTELILAFILAAYGTIWALEHAEIVYIIRDRVTGADPASDRPGPETAMRKDVVTL